MQVTALKAHPRNKALVKVYLDGQFVANLTSIVAARLRVGKQLDEAALAQLMQADADEQAYERALRFLTSRPRAEAEVRRRLQTHKVSPAAIDRVMERLRQAGFLDDKAFAAYWVENRTTFRPKSKRMLAMELKQKGVKDAGLLGEALAQANDDEAAYQVAVKRAARLRNLPLVEFKRKLGDFLARRGFSYETIEPIVKRVWTEVQTELNGDSD